MTANLAELPPAPLALAETGLLDVAGPRQGRLRRVLAARAALPENVRTVGWVSLANDSASELAYPLLPLFLVITLGAPVLAVGLIDGIPETIASFVRLASGWLSDKSAHRRRRWIFAGYAISSVARVLMAAAPTWGYALSARAVDRVGKGTRGAARDALIKASSAEGKAGASFGYHRSMDTLGAVIGPVLAATMLACGVSIRTALWVAVVPGVATLLLVRRIREVPHPVQAAKPHNPFPTPIRSLPPTFWRAVAIWTVFSIGNSSDVFLLLRARYLGLGSILIVLAYALYNVFYSGLSWPLGSLSDRIPRPVVLAGGMGLFSLVYLGFALAPAAWLVYPLFCLYGVYIAATEGVAKAWVADHVDRRMLGTAYGVFGLGTGLTALASSFLAGLLWVEVGPRMPFMLGAAAAALAAVLLLGEWRLGLRAGHSTTYPAQRPSAPYPSPRRTRHPLSEGTMSAHVRIRIEQALAAVTGALGVLTIFWRDWIEGLTGWNPDHHNGSAEVAILVGLFAVSLVFFLISRVELRRVSAAQSPS